jgi:uncharacterized phage protein (TIGR01671 family)
MEKLNRVIRFRAWDKERNKMIGSDYPDNWGDNKDEWWDDVDKMSLTEIENISKEMPVMQFTGLFDKNGKEIYEGDVVEEQFYDEGNKRVGIVEYIQVTGDFFGGIGFNISDKHSHPLSLEHCQVTGNIYENISN